MVWGGWRVRIGSVWLDETTNVVSCNAYASLCHHEPKGIGNKYLWCKQDMLTPYQKPVHA